MALLVEKGSNVDAQDKQGETPLHSAITYVRQNSEGHEQILRLLLQSGANVNVKDQYGWTPLH